VRTEVPKDIWCPHCGIPRNANMSLKGALRKNKKVNFVCWACGLKITIMPYSKSPKKETAKKKDEEEDIFNIKPKEVIGALNTLTKAGKYLPK